MRRSVFAATLCLGMATAAMCPAIDLPVGGHSLILRASDLGVGKRDARLVLTGTAIAAPFPDPTTASALIISGGVAAGQCRVELALDPANWRPIGADGTQQGYRYVDKTDDSQGVHHIAIRPGLISIRAHGVGWPCDLGAEQQRVPISVVFRAADTRYCAAFGGTVVSNAVRGVVARAAPPPAACPKTDLTVANLNFLHGFTGKCFQQDNCRLAERVDLLFQWIADSGCPDVVTLQEVWFESAPLIMSRLADVCPFRYKAVLGTERLGIDEEMVLTRYPAVLTERYPLFAQFRRVFHVRLDHPLGPLDVFSTHLASGSDGGPLPCGSEFLACPEECASAGAVTRRDCQAVQMAGFVASRHDVATPAVITGDFNARPDSFVYQQFVGRGWTDVYLAAGNPECNPATGVGCTSGREGNDLSDLESPTSIPTSRIEYIFLIPPAPGSLCSVSIDSGSDDDGDGHATRIFADRPNPFAPTCGPAPAPICWPSDHEGVELDLNCG